YVSANFDQTTLAGHGYGSFSGLGAVNHLPVVTAQDVNVPSGQSVAAASMFASVFDQDGDSIIQYGFWDSGSGGGYFTVNGVVQPAGQWIDVSPANLSTIRYWGGSSASSETIYIDAFDGKDWSNSMALTASTTQPTSGSANLSDYNNDQ